MQLANQLRSAGLDVFPCRADKSPAVPKGVAWADEAKRPVNDLQWPSSIVGLPVPDGVVIIDLDTYKGATREAVETVLGCTLPWDEALIQITLQGGQHYAFRCDWEVKFGSSLLGVKGLDTRSAGKGYIATGGGYQAIGFGPFRLANAAALPLLPDACRPMLEHVDHEPVNHSDVEHSFDEALIIEALAFVDPGGTRTDWIRKALSLRAYYSDDPDAGLLMFDRWSSGEFWKDGTPANYVPEHIPTQWWSFKADGKTGTGTLFYEAMQGGWQPPIRFDPSIAFGEGAAPTEAYNAVVERITESGCDPKQTNALLDELTAIRCNPLQQNVLLALLTRELKDAGLLSKAIKAKLDTAAGVTTAPTLAGQYGKNHTENAQLFLQKRYPNQTLMRSEEVWFEYVGQGWREIEDNDLKAQLANDMAPAFPQHTTVSGTYNMLTALSHTMRKISDRPENLIFFSNGVLDLTTGQLLPHDRRYFTTNVMPYAYDPNADCPKWRTFLHEIFEGDAERAALLQEWFGYMMSASYAFHKILFMIGSGRSGKGTIGRVLKHVVGPQNYTGGSLNAFSKDSMLDSWRTKTVMFIGDSELRVNRNVVDHVIERVKNISGNDDVSFERKYKSALSETLPTRITIAANGVPRLFDDSGALANRFLLLTFDVSFLGRENVHLIDELLEELPGIANWSLEGMRRLALNNQFTVPTAGQDEAQLIAETYSPMKQFIEEICTLGDKNASISTEDLFNVYKAWAIQNQEERILARRPFVSAFKDATRGRGCRYCRYREGEDLIRGFTGVSVEGQQSIAEQAFGIKGVN